MLNRLFVLAFLLALFAAPIGGLVTFALGAGATQSELQQKTMCLTTGIGCGSGYVILPAVGRL
ncbi:sugar transporter [Roseibium sp. RKSG952]|uniref:sugar transporter n=1 Tax=Roseibium sp. RKSG952 TaxID=2529384 RepID=UPI0012BC4EEB|nr:sugar transporter [Roseibium sp. RKSG952]MTI00339.1 sugar transporter [Roseibium sp. RKSG952]